MSQRISGYARLPGDTYDTPPWVTKCLLPHLRKPLFIWECAAGNGQMAKVLSTGGYRVEASDINEGVDFFKTVPMPEVNAIITNPPYTQARQFIERALGLVRPNRGLVAMLLRTDYDHADTRRALFTRLPFARKVVLTKRIRWIQDSTGSPSFNHAWFVWDYLHSGRPTIAYEPQLDEDGDG